MYEQFFVNNLLLVDNGHKFYLIDFSFYRRKSEA